MHMMDKERKTLENALQKFKSVKQADRILSGLNKQRLENHEICDVTIQSSDGDKCAAHMCVLMTSSSYFKALYGGRAIAESGARNVIIPELSTSTISEILTFLYTGYVELTQENVQALLQGADYLLVDDLKERIREYLMEVLNVKNCLDLLVTSDIYHFDYIKEASIEIIRSRLHDYIVHKDLLYNMSGHELCIIFQQKRVIEIVDKERMANILLMWARKNINCHGILDEINSRIILNLSHIYQIDLEDTSQDVIHELTNLTHPSQKTELKHISVGNITEFLPSTSTACNSGDTVRSKRGFDSDEESQNEEKTVKKVKLDDSNQLLSYYLSHDSDDERERKKNINDSASEPIFVPTLESESHEEVQDILKEEIATSSAASDEIDLVIVNGLGDNRNFCYIVPQNRWVQLPNLPDVRSNHRMTHLGKKLYTFGGNQVAYIPCEQYLDLEALTWSSLPPTRHMHLFPQAALPLNNKLYLLGNRGNGEIFHPVENTWTPMARYQRESYEVVLRAVVYNTAIYACFSEFQDRSGSLAQYLSDRPTFTRYNPIIDDWTILTPHVLDRSIGLLTEHHSLFTDEDHLYVVHYTHRNRRGIVHYKMASGNPVQPTLELQNLKDPEDKDNSARNHHHSIHTQWDQGMCMFEADHTILDCSRTYYTRDSKSASATTLTRGAAPPFMFGTSKHPPVVCHVKLTKSILSRLLALPTAKYKPNVPS